MEVIDMSVLAETAAAVFGEEHVRKEGNTVSLVFDEATLSFVAREDGASCVLCRAFVTALTRMEDPASYCQQALESNFFWQGTGGACLSVNGDATALYLTDRVQADEIADADRLFACVQRFTKTLTDWRLRARTAQGGVAALPQSADFSLPEEEGAPADNAAEQDAGMMKMEV